MGSLVTRELTCCRMVQYTAERLYVEVLKELECSSNAKMRNEVDMFTKASSVEDKPKEKDVLKPKRSLLRELGPQVT